MSEERKKPDVAFWATVTVLIVVLLAGYPLSYGPMAWAANHSYLPDAIVPVVALAYLPLAIVINGEESPRWLRDGVIWCIEHTTPRDC